MNVLRGTEIIENLVINIKRINFDFSFSNIDDED